ncbi:MAG: type IV pilus assembly protein PilM [Verrucomicrobiales bacterium]
MLKTKPFLCLDFGAGSVKVAEFATNEQGTLTLTQFGIKSLGNEGMQESKREAAVLKAIQALLSEKAYRGKQINVCAPGFHVFSKFVKLPQVDTSKVTQIIQYEAQQNVPFPLEEVVWDYQIIGATPTGELEVLLVAIKSDVVEGLFRTADASGLRLDLVDVSPAALCNAFRFNYGDLEGCTMLLDIGAKTSNVLFFEKGKVYARSINIGANSITTDFIAEAKIPFNKAEELKINEGFVSLGGAYEEPENPHQAAISKIARQVMTRLHMQVNQTIQFYRGQQGGSAPQRLFLAGGGSIMAYTAQFFAEKLNLSVEYFNPFRNITIDESVPTEELEKVAHSFGEVVGLGLRNLAQCPVELNLIPKTIRKRQALDQKKPYFIAAVFSLVAVVFAYGFFYSKIASVKQESLTVLSAQLEPLESRVQTLEQEQTRVSNAKIEIDTLTGYLKDRYYWAETLGEMKNLLAKVEESNRQPGREVGVWIETFGTVAAEETEEEDSNTPAANPYAFYMMDPMLAQRYGLIPKGFKVTKEAGADASAAAPASVEAKTAEPANTNAFTINVKFRAVNLNRSGESDANGQLAFQVANAFENSPLFDKDGTKLSGEIKTDEENPDTFTFEMKLKLKNAMTL